MGPQGPQGATGDLNVNSLIIRPDLWDENVEIPLATRSDGKVLYGKRCTGYVIAPANVNVSQTLVSLGTDGYVSDFSGWWSNGATKQLIGTETLQGAHRAVLQIASDMNLNFNSNSYNVREANAANGGKGEPYEIWVKYVK
jgi:hypothetical protein